MDNPQQLAGRREWVGLAILALPAFLVSMDTSVMYLAIPTISSVLHPGSAQLLWITDIYTFLEAGLLITMGTLGDRVGRRRLLLIGAVAFAAASAFAAFSTSAGMLVAARGILGITGATLLPCTLSLLRNMFRNDRQRTFAIGIWTTCFSFGTMLGPLIGGFLLTHFWWGSVFLMGVPVMLLLILLAPFFLPEFREPVTQPFDLFSALLSILSVLFVIYGIKRVADQGIGPLPILSIGVGLLVGIAFIRRQRSHADPLVDLSLFRIPAFTTSLTALFFVLFAWAGSFIFVAQYLQLMIGLSPLQAGWWTIPSAAGGVIGCLLAPQLLRIARRGFVMAAGMIIVGAGLGIFSQLGGSVGFPLFIVATMFLSGGCGMTVTLGADMVIGAVPPQRAGLAAGLYETSTTFGQAFGVAILGSIGTAFYHRYMAQGLPPGVSPDMATTARNTLGGALAVARQLSGQTGAGLLNIARISFAAAFRVTAGTAAVFLSLIAVGVAYFLRLPAPGRGNPGD